MVEGPQRLQKKTLVRIWFQKATVRARHSVSAHAVSQGLVFLTFWGLPRLAFLPALIFVLFCFRSLHLGQVYTTEMIIFKQNRVARSRRSVARAAQL